MPPINDGRVLARVRAAGVNIGDWHLLGGMPYAMPLGGGPAQTTAGGPGLDLAGEVEAVADCAEDLRAGDELFGWYRGAFAGYACVPEWPLVHTPASLRLRQAAAVGDSAFIAVDAVRDQGRVRPGARGAGQRRLGRRRHVCRADRRSFGARVTGVCSMTNVEMVRSMRGR